VTVPGAAGCREPRAADRAIAQLRMASALTYVNAQTHRPFSEKDPRPRTALIRSVAHQQKPGRIAVRNWGKFIDSFI
jgi:hypothetical protein